MDIGSNKWYNRYFRLFSLSGPIPMTITNALGSGSFVVTLLEDNRTEGGDAFKAELRTGSISGTKVKDLYQLLLMIHLKQKLKHHHLILLQ